MKRFIHFLFALVFMTNISCTSDSSEASEPEKINNKQKKADKKQIKPEEKLIRRWTSDVGTKNGFKGRITISVLDPDSTTPVLIEFIYETESRKMDFFELESFEVSSHETQGQFYKMILNPSSMTSYWSIFKYLPTKITWGMFEGEPTLFITEASKNTGSFLPVKVTEFTNLNFKLVSQPRPDNVRVAKAKENVSYSYFTPKGVLFPNLMADIKSSAIWSASSPTVTEAKPKITRWSAEFTHPQNGNKITMIASVFDAEKNPVLMELAYKINERKIDFFEVSKFEVVPGKNGDFKIHFKEEKLVSGKNPSPYYVSFPYIPKTLKFSLNDENPEFVLELLLNKANSTTIQATREVIAIADYKHVFTPVSHRVFEPSTVNDVSYPQYFSPKGIQFPLIKEDSSFSYSSSSWQSVNSIEELKLGAPLTDKKEVIWQFLKSKEKPTVTEFLNIIGIKPNKGDQNPFSEYARNANSLKSDLENRLPKVIAQFEKAFPGAIWYGLGRDIYLFSDAMDAYYLYQGQTDRVRRLHASQPSFKEDDPQEVIDFLKSNDFDFGQINKDYTPHIIFDVTSYSKGFRFSQSSQLMRAAYMEWARLNGNPHELLKKVNFVSVSSGPDNVMITPGLDIEDFFQKMEFDPPAPKRILQVDGPMSLQYSTAWHGLYERFERNGQKVESPAGSPASNSDKLAMLAELWDVAAIVMNGDFSTAVEKKIKEFNDPNVPKEIYKKTVPPPSIGGWIGNNFTPSNRWSSPSTCDELLDKPIGSE